jgi:hypothetical protein
MNKGLTILGAMGIGAGLMYVFDPDKGKKRRALMRDRLEDTARKTRRQIDRKSHEVGDLVSSIGASIKAPFTNGPLSDNDLLARVKEKVIEILPDTQDIKVRARNGIVTLGGWLPQRELDHLVKSVSSIPGVSSITNKLRLNDSHTNGGLKVTTAAPLVTGVVGGAVALYYLARGLTHEGHVVRTRP